MSGVYENIRNEKYKNKMPYPKRPAKPHLKHNASAKEAHEFAKALEAWEHKNTKYTIAMQEYHKMDRHLIHTFKAFDT